MKDYWNLKEWSQSTPFLTAIFTRDRFFMLQSMLHFPESDGETGKLKKVQYIVKHFSGKFLIYYMPKREVSIDECLIGCVRIETQQFNICPINIIRILVSR